MFALQKVSYHPSSLHYFLSIHTLIYVISNPQITTLVRPRKCHKTTQHRAPDSSNLQPMTTKIELSSWIGRRRIMRNNLMPHKVITGFQVTGDGVLNTGVTIDHEWRIAPSISRPGATGFSDFISIRKRVAVDKKTIIKNE